MSRRIRTGEASLFSDTPKKTGLNIRMYYSCCRRTYRLFYAKRKERLHTRPFFLYVKYRSAGCCDSTRIILPV